jgi:hypothetical protein
LCLCHFPHFLVKTSHHPSNSPQFIPKIV